MVGAIVTTLMTRIGGWPLRAVVDDKAFMAVIDVDFDEKPSLLRGIVGGRSNLLLRSALARWTTLVVEHEEDVLLWLPLHMAEHEPGYSEPCEMCEYGARIIEQRSAHGTGHDWPAPPSTHHGGGMPALHWRGHRVSSCVARPETREVTITYVTGDGFSSRTVPQGEVTVRLLHSA